MAGEAGVMDLGRFDGMPAAEYFALPARGSTAIRRAAETSVAHVLATEAGESTKSQMLGTVNHSCVLEPERLGSTYVVAERCQCEGVKANGDQCSRQSVPGAKHCHQHGGTEEAAEWEESLEKDGRLVVSQDVYDKANAVARGVRAAVKRCDWPGILGGDHEVTYVARVEFCEEFPGYRITTEPGEGMLVKARVDIWHPGLTVDLKGIGQTPHLSPHRFGWRILDYGMHVQAALYVDIIEAVEGERPRWAWLAHEVSPPFGVCIFDVDDGDLDSGREAVADGLSRWAIYDADGNAWDGWPTWRQTVRIPYRSREED